MLFGLQGPAQVEAAQIASAHARLQKRFEDDPSVPTMQPGGQAVIPPPAYVNGAAGSRISPDELAFRRRQNADRMAAGLDFSPVQSWTQGAARVANALIANLDSSKLARAAASSESARTSILRELTKANPGFDAVTAAISDPDPAVQSLGEKTWALQHPKPQGPSDLQQRVEYLDQFKPGLGGEYATNYAANGGGAPQFVTIPGRGMFAIPKSGIGSVAPTPPPVPAVGTVEDGYRFRGGDAANPANWEQIGGAPSQGGATFR